MGSGGTRAQPNYRGRKPHDGTRGPRVPSEPMLTQHTEVDLSWRSITTDDAPAWAALLAAAEAVDATSEHYDVDDLLEELADPALDPARDTVAAFDAAGTMVAYGLVRSASTVRDSDQYQLEGCVLPEHRRRGLGREVLARMRDISERVHRERYPELPGELHLRVHDGNVGNIALARGAGLTPVRYWYDMDRELGDLPAVPELDAGLRMIIFDHALDNAVRLARNEAFADHWGSIERDESDWRQWFTNSRSFRPALSLIVLDESGATNGGNAAGGEGHAAEVAGFLLSYEYEADVAASGVREAWIGQIGTRRAWRGRGVASVLIATALAGYAAAGYQRAALGVDTGNPTGALGLYERAGFVPTERWTTFSRPL